MFARAFRRRRFRECLDISPVNSLIGLRFSHCWHFANDQLNEYPKILDHQKEWRFPSLLCNSSSNPHDFALRVTSVADCEPGLLVPNILQGSNA